MGKVLQTGWVGLHIAIQVSLKMHTGTKTLTFGDLSCSLMKPKLNCLAIMAAVTFGEKKETLACLRWQHHVVVPGGSHALHTINDIMRKQHFVDITY